MNRKPPVVAIRTNTTPDIVTQQELRALSELQAAEWHASRAVQRAALKLEMRIERGARVEPGALHFDEHLKMVRTRRAERKA